MDGSWVASLCSLSSLLHYWGPHPRGPPGFLPLENGREGWTPASPPPTYAAGPCPCPRAHGVWGQGSSRTVPPKISPHGPFLGPAKKGTGLFWLRPGSLKELEVQSGAEAAAAVSLTVSIKDSTQRKNAGSGLAYPVQTAIWNTHTCNMHAFWHLTFS